MELSDINFLIIGAAKSATTWLQRSLQQHPDFFLPNPELHYFSRNYEQPQSWYLAQFKDYGGHSFIGEKSNSYIDDPVVAKRIHEVLPNVKLLAQFRNPVDRAYSDYCMLLRRGEVSKHIEDYLDPRRSANNRFLSNGFYFQQIEPYCELFNSEEIQILLYEDMLSNPELHLERVLRFIGANAKSPLTAISEKVKDKSAPTLDPRLKRVLRPFKPMVAPMRKHALFKALHRLISKSPDYPPLSHDMRDRLVDHYRGDTEKLGKLMGRDLAIWPG